MGLRSVREFHSQAVNALNSIRRGFWILGCQRRIKRQRYNVTIKDYLRSIKAFLRRVSWKLIRFSRKVHPPRNADGRILLHLGCGPINAPGYTNVDVQPYPHVHYVHNAYPLEIFKTNSIDLVYVSHVLEHFPLAELPDVLREWRRVLKIRGILRLGVPNFEVLASIYADTGDIRSIHGSLMGGQNNPHNYHYSVYDRRFLTELFEMTGFKEIRLWDPLHIENHGFRDTTTNVWNIGGRDYPISLNMEAVK